MSDASSPSQLSTRSSASGSGTTLHHVTHQNDVTSSSAVGPVNTTFVDDVLRDSFEPPSGNFYSFTGSFPQTPGRSFAHATVPHNDPCAQSAQIGVSEASVKDGEPRIIVCRDDGALSQQAGTQQSSRMTPCLDTRSPPMLSFPSSFRHGSAKDVVVHADLDNSSLRRQKHEGKRLLADLEEGTEMDPRASAAPSSTLSSPRRLMGTPSLATDVLVVAPTTAGSLPSGERGLQARPVSRPSREPTTASFVSATSAPSPFVPPIEPTHTNSPSSDNNHDDSSRLPVPHRIAFTSFDLVMDDVSLTFRTLRCPRRGVHPILSNVSAFLPAGSIACVLAMDQSRASAALSVLAGVESRATGGAWANQLPTQSSAFHAYVAYISSVKGIDVETTVEANLLFSTRMRVAMTASAESNRQEEHRRLEYAAEVTLLRRYLTRRVKDLSRAQLYQLAVAMELVRNPAAIFLDAPLQFFTLAEMHVLLGMIANLMNAAKVPLLEGSSNALNASHDASTSEELRAVPQLRQRRVVVLSATDLPLPLYATITHLVMLNGEGDVLYSGPKDGIGEFFARDVGVPNVQGEMVADLLAQMEDTGASQDIAEKFSKSRACDTVRRQIERHKDRIASYTFGPDGPGAARDLAFAGTADRVSPRQSFVGIVTHAEIVTAGAPRYAEQLRLLVLFTLRKHFATVGVIIPWTCLLAVFVVMVLVLALAGYSVGNDVQNRSGVIFFLLSCSLLLNSLFFDAEVEELSRFVHMRNNAYFRVSEYVITTALRLLLPRLIIALMAAGCSLLILRVASLPLILVLVFTSLAHAHLFLAALYWMPTKAASTTLWYVQQWYYGYCVIMSGFLVSLSRVPVVLQYLSLLRIGYGGLLATELRGSRFGCERESTSSSSSSSFSAQRLAASDTGLPCFRGEQYLALRGLETDSWGKSVVILLCVSMALFLLLAMSMYTTWTPRRF